MDGVIGMIEQGSGSLITTSSMTGKRPLAGRTPYAAAKMGVIGLCRGLALEVGPHSSLVEPEEVAAACVYLASARAAAVTGEDLNVSAGSIMY